MYQGLLRDCQRQFRRLPARAKQRAGNGAKETRLKNTQYPCAETRIALVRSLRTIRRRLAETLGALALGALLFLGGTHSGTASPSTPAGIFLYTASGTVDPASSNLST